MSSLFLVCFGVGVGYTVLSFILGQFFDIIDFDAGINVGTNLSPLKPIIIASFITVFGGVGLLLMNRELPGYFVLCAAAFSGLIVCYLLHRFVVVPLYKAQNTSVVEQMELIGTEATVTLTIQQGRYGKITYFVNGNTFNAPAKSDDGSFITVGEEVVIVSIKRNTYFVRKLGGAFNNSRVN